MVRPLGEPKIPKESLPFMISLWLSLVEHSLWERRVAGSNPAGETNAAIAQLVERLPCKQDVRGSIPRGGTNSLSDTRVAQR